MLNKIQYSIGLYKNLKRSTNVWRPKIDPRKPWIFLVLRRRTWDIIAKERIIGFRNTSEGTYKKLSILYIRLYTLNRAFLFLIWLVVELTAHSHYNIIICEEASIETLCSTRRWREIIENINDNIHWNENYGRKPCAINNVIKNKRFIQCFKKV